MADIAHEETEMALKRLEKDITRIYTRAAKECQEKLDSHLERYAKADKEKRAQKQLGIISEEEYRSWRTGQIAIGQRWEEMCRTLATDLANADKLAESMTNGYRQEVYALNHNYATFEVEKSSLVNTSYTLYDRQTVERLVAENPKILPDPRGETAQALREGKLIRWNMQKITGEVTQGILQGESVDKIAKRMRNVANMDYHASVRNARTAITGAQNAGRQRGYERAEKMGIIGKKMWLASMDGKTRHWHVETDGQVVPVNEPFVNEYGEIEYPGDSGAEPANVYNCRCTMIYVHDGFEESKREWLESRQNPELGNMSYRDWKKQHADAQAKRGYTPKPKTVDNTPKVSWVDRVRAIMQRNTNMDEQSIQEAGQILSQEIQDNYLKPLQENYERTKQEFEAAGNAEITAIRGEEKYNEAWELRQGWTTIDKANHFSSLEEAHDYWMAQSDRIQEIQQSERYQKAEDAFKKARRAKNDQTAHAMNLKDTLAQIREMGSDGLDIKNHLRNSRSPVRKNVEEAYDHYPKSWVEKSIQRGSLAVKKVDRGYYSDFYQTIAISGSGFERSTETAFHELGHRFERAVPEILKSEKDFYERRTAGESLEWLGKGYDKTETTRKDNFLNSYMGKDYGGRAYELVSMGFEYAYCDPFELAKDADMASWIYGLLATIP